MAVDEGAVADIEFAGDHFGAAPVEEIALDGLAVRMVADAAAAAVMSGVGFGLGGFYFGGWGGGRQSRHGGQALLGGQARGGWRSGRRRGACGSARVNIGGGVGVNEIGIVFAFAMVLGVILALGWVKVSHADYPGSALGESGFRSDFDGHGEISVGTNGLLLRCVLFHCVSPLNFWIFRRRR